MAKQLLADAVQVLVPATSGNLGPGFDCLGLAYDMYDQIEVKVVPGPTTVTVTGQGAGEVPLDENHLVLRALRHTLDSVGVAQPNLDLSCWNRIPHGRGLGSSAAAVVAGIMAARRLLSDPNEIPLEQVLALATEFEGHPDNAAPAIYGGATVSWLEGGNPQAVRIPMQGSVSPVLLVPSNSLATKAARAVLPDQVPFADAVFNVGRVALLLQALNGHSEHLLAATEDKLHQPYRAAVMPESAAVVAALRELGIPAVISGAGPTVLAFFTDYDYLRGFEPPLRSDDNESSSFGKALENSGINLDEWRILRLRVDEIGARTYPKLP